MKSSLQRAAEGESQRSTEKISIATLRAAHREAQSNSEKVHIAASREVNRLVLRAAQWESQRVLPRVTQSKEHCLVMTGWESDLEAGNGAALSGSESLRVRGRGWGALPAGGALCSGRH